MYKLIYIRTVTVHTYIHTYRHTDIHTYIRAYFESIQLGQTFVYVDRLSYLDTQIFNTITYIHITVIETISHIHTYLHTYIQRRCKSSRALST
jgi:hypothetical protein